MPESLPREELKLRLQRVSHIIIKLGTGILTPHIEDPSSRYFCELASQVANLRLQGKKVIIVSSGAVGFGKQILKQNNIKLSAIPSVPEKQAMASLGQSLLIDSYRDAFAEQKIAVGQVLVTRADFSSRTHYRNLKNTLDQLLEWNCIPIVNENDVVAISELKLGDNDTLSAQIAAMYPQALLILLTTVDRFYLNNQPVDFLAKVDSEILRYAGGASAGGTGGMRTKLLAAERLLLAGQMMVIASGKDPTILQKLLLAEGEGTWFFNLKNERGLSDRKRWLLHQKHSRGTLVIDQGAAQALLNSPASLLLVGVIAATGDFKKNQVVDIVDEHYNFLGKGIVSLSQQEISDKISHKKQYRGLEIIHRDNLIIIAK